MGVRSHVPPDRPPDRPPDTAVVPPDGTSSGPFRPPADPPATALSDALSDLLTEVLAGEAGCRAVPAAGQGDAPAALVAALAGLADGLGSRVDAELSALVDGLCELADAVEAARLAVLGEWESRASWALDGAPTGASWLAARGRVSRAVASGMVRTARHLRTMPTAAEELRHGRLAPAKARVLASAINERTAEAFARDEALLVGQAASLTVDQTSTMMRFWTARADPDGTRSDDERANRAHLSQTWSGRWRLDADLDAESGSILAGVWEKITDELRRCITDPLRPVWELRAEALVDLARRASGAQRSARPLIWVMAEPDVLRTGRGVAELVGSGPLSPGAAARLACDADVARVTRALNGEILDVGRAERTATEVQRRVLAARDRHCTFPGCARPPNWCEAHHIIWWDSGGPTDLANLCLLCSHHHHLIHKGRFDLARGEEGALVFTYADGRRLIAPPIAA